MDSKKPYIIIKRFPYEEPHYTQLEFSASNGSFAGATDFYCNVSDIAKIGQALQKFPQKADDEYRYEYGSEDPVERDYRYFLLRAYTIGLARCAVQIIINLNDEEEPHEGQCRFSIETDTEGINRLGALFVRFGQLKHLELRWTPDLGGDDLYENYQP